MNPNPETSHPAGATSPIHQHREVLEKAETVVYKKLEDGPDLRAFIFPPENLQVTDNRAGILFFHGSDWDHGAITQFAPHALYFANRGAFCVLLEYRLASTHSASPAASTQDARSAIRWLRFYSGQVGVDPQKIVAFGATAGAHIAAATAMNLDLVDDDTDPPLSGEPNAMVLFSPLIDVVKGNSVAHRFPDRTALKQAQLSRYIRKDLPPSLIFHGTRDRMAPFETTRKFSRKMKRKKNVCDLVDLEGRENRFFNLNVDPVCYEFCINKADQFLTERGFLDESADGPEDHFRLQSWRELNS